MNNYLRIPFSEEETARIQEEMSLEEQKQAIIRAFNESVESEEEGELAEYDNIRDIRYDESLSEAEQKRLILKGRRRGLTR